MASMNPPPPKTPKAKKVAFPKTPLADAERKQAKADSMSKAERNKRLAKMRL